MGNRLAVVSIAAIALLAPASALGTSVSLNWAGTTGTGATGSSAISVSDTAVETLTLDLILAADAAGVSSYFLSLRFDTDIADELNVLGYAELSWSNPAGTRTMTNLNEGIQASQESSGTEEGFLFTFEAESLGDGPVNTSLTFGRVFFETNPENVQTDGLDIFSGIFFCDTSNIPNPGCIDALFDNAGNSLEDTALFGGASVNVPEPAAAALLAVAAAAILLASRAPRRKP